MISWCRLSEEAARLIKSKQVALESIDLRNSVQEWCGLCDFGLPICAERASVFERALNVGAVARGFDDLRLGLGSPGYNGCLHMSGNCIRWKIFDNASFGIVAAMTRLDIHIMGLPCARLPDGFAFPERYGLKCFARGGPSYSSCAVIWKSVCNFVPMLDVGSNRRLWLRYDVDGSLEPLFVVVLYLPAGPDGARGEDGSGWFLEMEGLSLDVVAAFGSLSNVSRRRIILMGDINVQPSGVGGNPDRRTRRVSCWDAFLDNCGVKLLNPCLTGTSCHPVWLPVRRKTLHIRPGHTHHGPGSPSTLDVVAASPLVVAGVTIHNKVHCEEAEGGCRLDCCAEYTQGDHFLVEICTDVPVPRSTACSYRMPRWWLSESSLRQGLAGNCAVLAEFRKILDRTIDVTWFGGFSHEAAAWMGDVAAWTAEFIMALIRDGWVLPRCPPRLQVSSTVVRTWLPDTVSDWERDLATQLHKGDAPRAVVDRCYRWLRPVKPTPPACLVIDGKLATAEESHAERCAQVGRQRAWPNQWDAEWHTYVTGCVASSLGRSWARRGTAVSDSDVSWAEVSSIMQGWDKSDATTPDLIPT